MDGYKTLIGAIVALLAQVATLFGVDIGDTDGLANAVITIGGAVFAIYGRVSATTRIGGGKLE